MAPVFYIMALVTFLCGMGLLGCVLLTRTSRATVDRILELTSGQVLERKRVKIDLKSKLLVAASWLRVRLGLSHKDQLIERFVAAGIYSPQMRDLYAASRLVVPVIAAVIGLLLPSHRSFWAMALGGVAYLLPDILLTRKIKSRRKRIQLSIPDAVDLLVICVDAGLGLDQAMLRVGIELETSHPDIYVEFQQINREQRAGKQRMDAWNGMAKRVSLPEIDAFVNMLMQTERFGTPVARALSSFADGLRQKRRQKAEEMAAKTTVKIIFPLVLFIFPSLFVVLIGPAAINIIHGLGSH